MNSLLRISESASLALHVASLLARHPERRFSTAEIAKILAASEHTLAKVMQRLSRAGLVESLRGPTGGFLLARPAAELTVLDIYEAVDGPLGEAGCLLGKGPCVASTCLLGGLVARIHDTVRQVFQESTLQTLSESMKLGDTPHGHS